MADNKDFNHCPYGKGDQANPNQSSTDTGNHNVFPSCSSVLCDFLLTQGFDTPESISTMEFEDLSDIPPVWSHQCLSYY